MVQGKIQAFYKGMLSEHHRYRSWEHCYGYFQRSGADGVIADLDHAALQLGFYLASWGMYRGSSFLLQHTYTVHKGVIEQLASPRFSLLWEREFAARPDDDEKAVPVLLDAIVAVREAYSSFATLAESGPATDTLVTKVLLGTLACLPACDRFFIDGFKSEGLRYSYLNEKFVGRVLYFCRDHLDELRHEQDAIESMSGTRYPLMKLIDMYFWQIGFEHSKSTIEPALQL
jgi:hypothetical protein